MLLPRRLLKPGLAFLNLQFYRLLLGFAILYGVTMNWAHTRCWRDPTSAFFAEDKAYEPAYSVMRIEQANAFLEHANNDTLRADHNAPDACRSARDAQVRLLLSGVGLSTSPHQRFSILVRV